MDAPLIEFVWERRCIIYQELKLSGTIQGNHMPPPCNYHGACEMAANGHAVFLRLIWRKWRSLSTISCPLCTYRGSTNTFAIYRILIRHSTNNSATPKSHYLKKHELWWHIEYGNSQKLHCTSCKKIYEPTNSMACKPPHWSRSQRSDS